MHLSGVARQKILHQRLHDGRNFNRQIRQALVWVTPTLQRAVERILHSEDLVRDRTCRPQIRLGIIQHAERAGRLIQDFGSHQRRVTAPANFQAGEWQVETVVFVGQAAAEIADDEDRGVFLHRVQEDVVGLEITVSDPVRRQVRHRLEKLGQ